MADEECIQFVKDHRLYKFVTFVVFAVSLLTFIVIQLFCPPKFKRNGYLIKKFNSRDYTECELESILKNEQNEDSTNNLLTPSSEYTILTPEEDVRIPIKENESKSNGIQFLQDRNKTTKLTTKDHSSSNSCNNNAMRSNTSCNFVSVGKQETRGHSASSRSIGQLSNSGTPRLLKRCTSSQELLPRKQDHPVLNSYSSMPSVNADDPNVHPLMQLADQCVYSVSLSESKETDKENEGAMQCAISYDRHRYIHLSGLALQTTLPPEAPGFVVELSLVPKDMDAARSKVYMTQEDRRSVDMSINETFKLNCTDNDIEKCSIVITVKPLLGNIIFYAETELKSLDLLLNAEVYLAGYLKGVKTYTLAYND